MLISDGITERRDRAATPPRAVILRIVAGPDAGTEARLMGDSKLLVGTSPTCALRLSDRRVSRRHLAVEWTPEGVLLRDLGSTNGTFIRGVQVREVLVPLGVPIELGDSHITAHDLEDVTTQGKGKGSPSEPPADERESFGRMQAKTHTMRRLFALAERLALADVAIVIEGEIGTGKELLAEELHAHSVRANGPLVVFDALSDDPQAGMIALFGSAPGVWPGAPEGRVGLLEHADGGTLLIDEPADLSADQQRRLARALTRREVQRVGSNSSTPIDVRVISTSSVDLDRVVERGAFREDLFFALVGARLEIPPLRKRAQDVAHLARQFWSLAGAPGGPPESLLARLSAHGWPGNVRELENAIARHLATGELDVGATARASLVGANPGEDAAPRGDSTDFVGDVLARRLPLVQARQDVVTRFERLYVEQVLRENGGNVTHAARASGLAHRYFQALKARHGR